MSDTTRVVFDCNVFIQALGAPSGPAGECVKLVLDGKVALFVSPRVLSELRSVATRSKVAAKLRVRASRIDRFIANIESVARVIEFFAEIFTYQRDPADAHYINLAIAAGANHVVTRDKDLLELMDRSKRDGQKFHRQFPALRIVDPVSFLKELAPREEGHG